MTRKQRRIVIKAATGLVALSFGVLGLMVPIAAADQGKSDEHSQRSEHSQGSEQPGSKGTAHQSSDDSTDANDGSRADHSSGNAGTSGDPSSPQPGSNADFSGNGANQHGPYDSTRDGSASQNGNGGGQATGRPCAGCVGKADNKNPKGQMPDGSDPNAGYECDRNHGIGRTNPAHTGCELAAPPPTTPPTTPPGKVPPGKVPPGRVPPGDVPRADVRPVAVVSKAVSAAKITPAARPVLAGLAEKLAITGFGPGLLLLGLAAIGLGGVCWMSSTRVRRLATR